MTFTTTPLVNGRTLVHGTDKFGTVASETLDTTQWDEIKLHDQHHLAEDAFASAVDEFFAPVVAAAESFNAAVTKAQAEDPLSYIVLHDGVEGVAHRPADVIRLNRASQIMRVLENNDGDRLVWVNDQLEILAVDNTVQTSIDLLQSELGAEVIGTEPGATQSDVPQAQVFTD